MVMGYSAYKDTGIPWRGEIPEEWDLKRNKFFLNEQKETVGEHSADYDLLSLTLRGIVKRDIASGKGKFPASFDKYKKVRKGDIAFCLFDIDETPRTVGLSSYDGMLTGAYDIFSVQNINASYMYYYYMALDNVKALKPLYTGLRKTIPINSFLAAKTPVPSPEEQSQIVRVLDWQISRINKAIKNIRSEITLLSEQKTALISDMVFKGTKKCELTERDIFGWKVTIPEHWDILKFNHCFSFGKGLAITKANLVEEGIPVISYGQIHSKVNSGTKLDTALFRFVSEEYISNNPTALVNKGDFIFADTSEDLEGVGNAAYVDRQMTLFAGYHTVITRPFSDKNTKYLAYLFQTPEWRLQIRPLVNRVKVYSITQKILKMAYVVLPPVDEQEEITDYLDSHCEQFDICIDRLSRQIEVLEEYKKRILLDTVTGKVDVRNVEVPDYQRVEDEDTDEELDDSDGIDEED